MLPDWGFTSLVRIHVTAVTPMPRRFTQMSESVRPLMVIFTVLAAENRVQRRLSISH